MSDLELGDKFITHDWGVDEEVVVLEVMQQSIRLLRPDGQWYFQTPGLVRNHMGKKESCGLCDGSRL